MGKIKEFFGNPGERPGLHCQAPIPAHHNVCAGSDDDEAEEKLRSAKKEEDYNPVNTCSVASVSDSSDSAELSSFTIQQNGTFDISRGFTGLHKGYMDRILDKLVLFAGTITVFYCVWIILIIWVVLGAVYNAPFNWQVVMQDGQSIQCYVWDTLLMRQQLSSSHEQLIVCANLRSRMASFQRMVKDWALLPHSKESSPSDTVGACDQDGNASDNCACGSSSTEREQLGQLPIENWYDRVSNYSSIIIGSVAAMVVFWMCIIVWIGCGAIPQAGDTTAPFTGKYSGSNPQYKKFSDAWQMDINTAVAVSLLICTTFLQNIRARHDKFIAKILLEVFSKDEHIDLMLRSHLDDYKPHTVINIPEAKRSWLQKIIDWYADIIGTGIGVIIAIIVFGVWIGIGTPLHWGDDWWLIIGTYTGLVGFIDGYVLREVYYRSVNEEEKNYAKVIDDDLQFMQQLGVPNPRDIVDSLEQEQAKVTSTMHYKISAFVNMICSHQYSVVLGVLIVVGLICASSGMKWSTTGQLIANTPTMIIEEFFLIVLIQAHNWADVQRRLEMSTILAHRRIMESHIEKMLA